MDDLLEAFTVGPTNTRFSVAGVMILLLSHSKPTYVCSPQSRSGHARKKYDAQVSTTRRLHVAV